MEVVLMQRVISEYFLKNKKVVDYVTCVAWKTGAVSVVAGLGLESDAKKLFFSRIGVYTSTNNS
jgi:hypothetical protein